MLWLVIVGGLVVAWFAASASRKRKQRLVLDAWRESFPLIAGEQVRRVAPNLAAQWTAVDYNNQFDRLYAELLIRFGAADFAGLMRRTIELGTGESERLILAAVSTTVAGLPGIPTDGSARTLVEGSIRRAMEQAGETAQRIGDKSGEI